MRPPVHCETNCFTLRSDTVTHHTDLHHTDLYEPLFFVKPFSGTESNRWTDIKEFIGGVNEFKDDLFSADAPVEKPKEVREETEQERQEIDSDRQR